MLSSNDLPDASIDRMMFSATVRFGSRLKLWKITPMSWLRKRYRSRSDRSVPSTSTIPSVGFASPEISDSSVVLPAPDGPVMACTLPAWKSWLMFFSTRLPPLV